MLAWLDSSIYSQVQVQKHLLANYHRPNGEEPSMSERGYGAKQRPPKNSLVYVKKSKRYERLTKLRNEWPCNTVRVHSTNGLWKHETCVVYVSFFGCQHTMSSKDGRRGDSSSFGMDSFPGQLLFFKSNRQTDARHLLIGHAL